jgi:hypothetical protein
MTTSSDPVHFRPDEALDRGEAEALAERFVSLRLGARDAARSAWAPGMTRAALFAALDALRT